ncbi:major facilitator superfamily domain-containing protein [Geranomyces variabilis]|nr:major facilitator superfamily domain-containing protein [Geranomyces variabilis]
MPAGVQDADSIADLTGSITTASTTAVAPADVAGNPGPLHTVFSIDDTAATQFDSAEATKSALPPPLNQHPEAPDGGYGWVVVFSGFLANTVVFGWNNVWGVVQKALHEEDPSLSLSTLAFVGGVALGAVFLGGAPVAWMQMRFGTRPPLFLGTSMMVAGLELASLATQTWQLFLTLSVLWGLGSSIMFLGTVAVPSQWFSRKRALATGLASSGSGFGGLVFAPVAQKLIDAFGIPWTFRIFGFVTLVAGLTASFTMKRLFVPPRPDKYTTKRNSLLDREILAAPGFKWFLAFAFFDLFGYIVPFYFLPAYATSIGLSSQTGATLVAVMSGINAVGRIFAGRLADHLGRINVLILNCFIGGLSCLVIWTVAKSFAALLVFTLIYGVFSGAYWALCAPAVAEVVGLQKLPSALTLVFFTNVLPLIFSGPLASAIYTHTGSDSYVGSILFAGVAMCFGSSLLLGTKFAKNRRLLAKV